MPTPAGLIAPGPIAPGLTPGPNDGVPADASAPMAPLRVLIADDQALFRRGLYVVLGTDGYGRSDTRKQLRKFFEVNRYYVVIAALKALADEGTIPVKTVSEAIKKYGIDVEKPAPWTV